MKLLKDQMLVDDRWQRVADDAPLPGSGAVLVSAARLKVDAPALLMRKDGLGVALKNTDRVADIEPFLPHLMLVALEFPKFTDGRAYSQARLLREQHAYRGELRATGQVLVDQLLFMQRCGFDAFEVSRPERLPEFLRALSAFSVVYQPTGDGRAPISALRQRIGHLADRRPTQQRSSSSGVGTMPSCTVATDTQRGSAAFAPVHHASTVFAATPCASPSAASLPLTPFEPSSSPRST